MRKILTPLLLLSFLLSACSIPAEPTQQAQAVAFTDVTEVVAQEGTATEPVMPTEGQATAEPISNGEQIGIAWVHMVDANVGWAWSVENGTPTRLVRTTDAGANWTAVGKLGIDTAVDNVFLDANTAWVAGTTNAGDWKVLHTADAGETWEDLPIPDAIRFADIEFFTQLDGIAVLVDGAAGSAYYTVYETTDGGREWSLIPFISPSPEEGLPEGTLHLCNICGDILYYDGLRAIIVKGDMVYDPTGKFQVLTTLDRGLNWSTTEIVLPEELAAGNVNPMRPTFNMATGILPMNVVKNDAEGNFESSILLMYKSEDGGFSWTSQGARLSLEGVLPDPIHYVNVNDIYTQCGVGICYTNDGGRTFVGNPLPIKLGDRPADILSMEQYQFISANEGFAISRMGEFYQLWHTVDNGITWVEIQPLLVK